MSDPLPQPPFVGRWLVRRLCDPRWRDIVEGDLDELFLLRASAIGPRRARSRYLLDVLSLLGTGYSRLAPASGSGAPAPMELLMNLLQDVRQAARALWKTPTFSAVVVLTLALAIGANTAIFSVVDGVLLDPLPYDDPEELVMVSEVQPEMRGIEGAPRTLATLSLYKALLEAASSFDSLAMYTNLQSTMKVGEETVRLGGAQVSPSLFSLLGVQAIEGRTFTPDEERPGNEFVMLLGHRAWQRYFGGDPSVVGRRLEIDETPYTVVGIMPPGFAFPDDSGEFWTPFVPEIPDPGAEGERRRMVAISVETRGGDDSEEGAGAAGPGGPGGAPDGPPEVHTMEIMGRVIGRLADGVAPAVAAEESTTLLRGLREGDTIVRIGAPEPTVEILSVQELLVGPVRSSLLLLMGAVGFVLLIACANVANLVVARSGERRRETAVRAALGAGGWQLATFLFIESLLLSIVGAIVGVGLAWLALRGLAAQAPEFIPRIDNIAIDARVILFTLAVTVLTALLFSLVPIRGATNMQLTRALKDEFRGGAHGIGGALLRKLLVTAEVALSVVLLVGATLLVVSFIRLASVDPGYDPDNLLRVQLQLPAAAYPSATAHVDFYDRLTASLEQVPGVESATVVSSPPSSRANIQIAMSRSEGPVEPDAQPQPMGVRVVDHRYFDAIGAELIAGRGFTDEDRAETLPVAVMSESAAQIMFPGEDPIGKPVRMMGPELEVVGVVRDVRASGTDPVPLPDLFTPLAQSPPQMVPMLFRTATLLVRTSQPPMTLVPALRARFEQLDASVPVLTVAAVRDELADSVAEPRFYASLVAAFAMVAVVLAAVGIYGLLSYTVQQGIRDTAIRRALGAPVGSILRRVVGEGMTLALLGLVLGVVGALATTRVLEAMLYEIEPTDVRSFIMVVAIFLIVSLVAVWLPARRATRIDPMEVLRHDG